MMIWGPKLDYSWNSKGLVLPRKAGSSKRKKGRAWMETAVNLLIRPPRNEYLPSQLGPTQFTIAGRRYRRHDLEVQPPPYPPTFQ